MWVNSAPPLTPNVPLILDGETATEEHPAQMYLDHAVPGLYGHVGEPEGVEHARIVDENVNRAELVDGGLYHDTNVFDLAHIGAHRDGLAAVLPDGIDNCTGSLLVLQIIYDHLGALSAESFSNAAAQATAASGDDGNLLCQPSFTHSGPSVSNFHLE